MELFNDDCLNILPQLEDNSVDLFFTDLPYGQTSCKWDKKIDLNEMWNQLNRVCKINCPMIFTTTTKFGVELINSNPKNFRYDLVWVKTAPTGFLNAKKMPMRKHEMIYVFYRKLPFYNIEDNHTHKFLKQTKNKRVDSVYNFKMENEISHKYEPPLPTSIIKTDLYSNKKNDDKRELYRNEGNQYDPPLPTSIIKNDDKKIYGCTNEYTYVNPKRNESIYDPPLPTTLLEIKSEKGKHQTQKPTELMEWILKYYSKEGDVVLDCCMGSGSMGVACKKLNRNFIGIELNEEIFKNTEDRLNN